MPEALREAIEDLQDVSAKHHRQEAVDSPFNHIPASSTFFLLKCCMPEADSVASAECSCEASSCHALAASESSWC